jgi:hypothetical protein
VGRQPGSKDLAIPRAHHDVAAIAGELVGEILGRPQAADPCIFGPASLGSERPDVHGVFYRNSTAWSSDFATWTRHRIPGAWSSVRISSFRDGFARHSLLSAFSGPFKIKKIGSRTRGRSSAKISRFKRWVRSTLPSFGLLGPFLGG